MHLVSFRNTDVYNCIASCQLSYYRCLQLYCILSTFVIQMSTTVLHPVNIRNTDVYNCIASCQLSYYRCLQLYCILSTFVIQMSTTVLHPVNIRNTDVYNCIASCQLSYYILSTSVLHNVSICPSKPCFSIKIAPICTQFSERRIGKIRIMFNKHHAILLGERP